MGLFALVSLLLTASAQDRFAYYADTDGDGYGNPRAVRYALGPTAGYTRQVGDCDDRDARVRPGATEVCNERDDDCDGLDDGDDPDVVGAPVWYADTDDDGFGDPRTRARSCYAPFGYVDIARDCNDRDDMANPLAFEFCSDGDDDDCDGFVDECDVSLDDASLVIEGSYVYSPLAVADMDGDGTGDLVVGTYLYDEMGGAVYVLYGPASGEVLLDDAVTVGAMRADDSFGFDVGAGDADGDGFDDLLVGAMQQSPNSTYLFLGPVTSDRAPWNADAVLTNRSANLERLQLLVTADHDGDGGADVVVGSADDGDSSNEGAVYVAPGASIETVALRFDATYIYEGEGQGYVGTAVADLGDASGDGLSDLAISGPWLGLDGSILIVEGGSVPGRYVAADIASATVTGNYHIGDRVQAIDYDGDGSMDLIAGDQQAHGTHEYTGGVLAFSGPFTGSMDATDATTAWEWTSATTAAIVGGSFAAEDFDGDGETDLVIGAYGNYDGNDSGAVFFQWGIASGLVDVGSLPYVTGAWDGNDLGREVIALPDWNGDAIPEVGIEAGWSPDYSHSLIYGFFSGSY